MSALDVCLSVLPIAISAAALIISARSISAARDTNLTGTYFSEKTRAYHLFLDYVAKFVFSPSAAGRDSMASALLCLRLFASEEILTAAETLYKDVIDYGCRPDRSIIPLLDERINSLSEQMRSELSGFSHCR